MLPKSMIQFIKFGLVGVSNTVLGLGLYYFFLWLGCHYLVANILSWILSVFNAFYWNHRYVFQSSASWLRTLIRTYFSYGASMLAGTALLYLLVDYFGSSEYLAPVLCLLLTVPLNFLLNKFWTFR